MATVQIKDLSLRTIIGIEDWERAKEQDILINLSFDYNSAQAARTDDIAHAVDYKKLKEKIIALVKDSKFNLVEKLAAEVLGIIMAEPRVEKASVTIDKPNALRFARSVSLTLAAVRS